MAAAILWEALQGHGRILSLAGVFQGSTEAAETQVAEAVWILRFPAQVSTPATAITEGGAQGPAEPVEPAGESSRENGVVVFIIRARDD